ncbi:MAG: hypothetical protein WC700_14275 [Gemmatimonadaceae bacterium]
MSIIKYRTEFGDIARVEVLRETAKCVFIKRHWGSGEHRDLKVTSWRCYFDTFEEAKAHLLAKAWAKADEDAHQKRLAHVIAQHADDLAVVARIEALTETEADCG